MKALKGTLFVATLLVGGGFFSITGRGVWQRMARATDTVSMLTNMGVALLSLLLWALFFLVATYSFNRGSSNELWRVFADAVITSVCMGLGLSYFLPDITTAVLSALPLMVVGVIIIGAGITVYWQVLKNKEKKQPPAE
jgi:hypothetical protein